MKTSEHLQAAKTCLLENKWGKGFGGDGTICVDVALGRTYGIYLSTQWLDTGALEVLKEVVGGGFVYQWNDAPDTTFQDVMDAFDAAILLAKEREAAE